MQNEILNRQYDFRGWETTIRYKQSEIRQPASHKNKLAKLQKSVFYSTKKFAFAFITTFDQDRAKRND